jgi:phage replication O-like protein O
MANPQKENGHIGIANEVAEALMRFNITAYQSRVLWAILRKTYGWQKKEDRISLTQFEQMAGIKKRHVQRTLGQLKAMNLITINKPTPKKVFYGLQKNYEEWKSLRNLVRVLQKKKETKKKETI